MSYDLQQGYYLILSRKHVTDLNRHVIQITGYHGSEKIHEGGKLLGKGNLVYHDIKCVDCYITYPIVHGVGLN